MSELSDAEGMLKSAEALLKKYPHSFSMKVAVEQWKERVKSLKDSYP